MEERFWSGFHSQADTNFINYSNPEYDRLYEQVRKSTDEQEQIKLYQEMETLLSENAANVYIQDMAAEVVLRKDFGAMYFIRCMCWIWQKFIR